MTEITLRPIGRVHSTLTDRGAAPKQADGAPAAWVEFESDVEAGLADLRVGDDVILLSWLHHADRGTLVVHPRDDPSAPLTGVFSTRSADRPNPIGVHPARIVAIDGRRVRVDRLEAIDGTSIVDVKPMLRTPVLRPRPSGPARAVPWGDFASQAPELAAFGAARLRSVPASLATVRPDGFPRVHPVTPVLGDGRLFVFMEPTSPKRRDLEDRGSFALHNGVPDSAGTGGEFTVSGRAAPVIDAATRRRAVEAASFEPAERYVLFELLVSEARANGYGDVQLPSTLRWRAPA